MSSKNRTLYLIIFVLLFCIFWHVLSEFSVFLPGPISVLWDLVWLFRNGVIWHILVSAERVFLSLELSFVFGVSLGLLSAKIGFLDLLFHTTIIPLIEAVPPLCWIVICVFIVGMGEVTVLFVLSVVLTQFFLVNTIEGIKNIDRNLVEMARTFTLDKTRILRHVELYMMAPYLWAAIRVAYGVSWKVLVLAEMFGASEGIGYLMNQAYSTLSVLRVISLSVLLVLLFSLGDLLILRRVERRFRKWQQ